MIFLLFFCKITLDNIRNYTILYKYGGFYMSDIKPAKSSPRLENGVLK